MYIVKTGSDVLSCLACRDATPHLQTMEEISIAATHLSCIHYYNMLTFQIINMKKSPYLNIPDSKL